MLISILGLYFFHHRATGYIRSNIRTVGTPLSASAAILLMLGFFVAFAVKLPMFPLHTGFRMPTPRLPRPAVSSSRDYSSRTGAYGMLRFVVPLFPGAAHQFAPVAMAPRRDRNHLWRRARLWPDRSEAPRRLYQRHHWALSGRHFCVEFSGITRRCDRYALPWIQHRRALCSCGLTPGANTHARDGPAGRPLGNDSPSERLRSFFCAGIHGIARPRRFRGRVSDSARHLSARIWGSRSWRPWGFCPPRSTPCSSFSALSRDRTRISGRCAIYSRAKRSCSYR